jgi:hypothetical protein
MNKQLSGIFMHQSHSLQGKYILTWVTQTLGIQVQIIDTQGEIQT